MPMAVTNGGVVYRLSSRGFDCNQSSLSVLPNLVSSFLASGLGLGGFAVTTCTYE